MQQADLHIKKTLRKGAKVFSWFLLALFAVLALLSARTGYQTYKAMRTGEQLIEVKKLNDSDWSHGMLELNSDYAGWLTVYGTQIDNPVVLGETNDTYLRRDFYGEWSIGGTLFLDETTDLLQNGNRIIYGHKMNDETFFGSLDQFKDKEFFEKNGVIRWEDSQGTHYYKVFAVMVVPGDADMGGYVNFQQFNNRQTAGEKKVMLATVEEKASIYQESWETDEDEYIFLITCDYSRTDGRLVVVGRSI